MVLKDYHAKKKLRLQEIRSLNCLLFHCYLEVVIFLFLNPDKTVCVLCNTSIRYSSIFAYININKFIVTIYNGHQRNTIKPFIIIKLSTSSGRLQNMDVFSINWSPTVYKLPLLMKSHCNSLSFILRCRKLKQLQ